MDKFGIFKLLNSFYNFYEKNKNNFPSADKEKYDASSMPFFNQKQPTSTTEKDKKTPSTPLQTNMLSTMNSHDAIVKRVLQKSKK